MRLKLGQSCHGMNCVQLTDATQEECDIVKATIVNTDSTSQDYIKRIEAHPFLQGFDAPKHNNDGWVLIEFWTDNLQQIQKFVDYLNDKLIPKSKSLGPSGKSKCPECGNSSQNATPADRLDLKLCANCKLIFKPMD